MKIGIDFGTSYTSAAAYKDGRVQHILFEGEKQFRTAAFFPDREVDLTAFRLTEHDENEVSRSISATKADYSRRLSEYNERVEKYKSAEKKSARESKRPYDPERVQRQVSMLAKPVIPSDTELRKAAVGVIRRRWVDEQANVHRNEKLDLARAIFGEEAVDALSDYEGRLFQSPKSMLGYKLDHDKKVFITSVVSRILQHIREQAELQLGEEVFEATLGRPVKFRSSMGMLGESQALEMLESAALKSGFTSVDFLPEPSAAAVGYHATSNQQHHALVIDIGGGTTDIALAEVGGSLERPNILKTWGIAKGGTDIDQALSLRSAMPLFGKDNCPELLAPIFVSAAAVSDVNRQHDFRSENFSHVRSPYQARLQCLQKPGFTARLNRDVERIKIQLSFVPEATASLDYIESELTVHATKNLLTESASRFMATLETLLIEVKDNLDLISPVIFLTGGTSQAPYVATLIKKVFPELPMASSDASLGVVDGLAIYAGTSEKKQSLSHA